MRDRCYRKNSIIMYLYFGVSATDHGAGPRVAIDVRGTRETTAAGMRRAAPSLSTMSAHLLLTHLSTNLSARIWVEHPGDGAQDEGDGHATEGRADGAARSAASSSGLMSRGPGAVREFAMRPAATRK